MDTFWMLAQLELLSDVELRVMHRSARTPERWIGASLHGVNLGGDGTIRTVSGHGATVEEALAELFTRLTQPGNPDLYVVIESRTERRALRWDAEFGSWTRVHEDLRVPA